MRVLLLSPYGSAIARVIKKAGDQVTFADLSAHPNTWPEADFVVMFGHRQIVKDPFLTKYKNRFINIHGSFLPWNRGAFPNLFSWVDNTPKGASIHYVNGGIDTGSILVRQSVDFSKAPNTTLATSYEIIKFSCEELFERSWCYIRTGELIGTKQDPRQGTVHTAKDAEPIISRLPRGWDTPVMDICAGSKNCSDYVITNGNTLLTS